jgi:hypothetical protein
MPTVTEGKLRFTFAEGWNVSKFDEWSFYRGQFSRVGDAEILCRKDGCDGTCQCSVCGTKRMAGTRGIDILAIDPGSICWHIEVKDYRATHVTNFLFLADAVALKVRDTLSCLVVARINANDSGERDRAALALGCTVMRVVLHLEQSQSAGPLLSPTSLRANVQQRLKQLVKAIDVRPLVVSMNDMNELAWSVAQVRSP